MTVATASARFGFSDAARHQLRNVVEERGLDRKMAATWHADAVGLTTVEGSS